MSDEVELDNALNARFTALRASDAREAPEFDALIDQARREAISSAAPRPVARVDAAAAAPPRWTRIALLRIALLTGGPMLAAAALGAVWFNANRQADRAFDQTVTAWSQTAGTALHSPTDALLALPGDEYLRTVPDIGRGTRAPRRGS